MFIAVTSCISVYRPGRCLSSDNLSVASDGSTASLPNLRPSRSSARRMLACTLDTEVVPEVTEVHINPVVLRKGFLNFMEETSRGWIKRWVVSDIHCLRFIVRELSPNSIRSKLSESWFSTKNSETRSAIRSPTGQQPGKVV